MAEYLHKIATDRSSSVSPSTVEAGHSVQVVIGTAPINQLDNPLSAVNKPIACRNRNEFKQNFGWSDDFESYTLMQSAYASLQLYGVAPVVFINVLDPNKTAHVTAVTDKKVAITKAAGVIEDLGVLLNTVTIAGSVVDTDYVLSFDAYGNVIISVTSDGNLAEATEVTVAYKKLNPSGVTEADIIGGIDENNIRKGIELLDEVYAVTNLVPELILAPGWSHNAPVAFALEAKAELAGDLTNAIAIVDIEAETTVKIDDVATAKGVLGVSSRWTTACWPMVKKNGYKLYMSALLAALIQNTTARNSNVPSESPSNLRLLIDAVCLADGTEKNFTQAQVNNYLNAYGVVSAIYLGGWKAWGNNTTAYPDNMDDPNVRFIKNVMMANYLENRFKVEYLSRLDRNASPKNVSAIVTEFNASMNALVPDILAGAEIVFLMSESDFINGHLYFETRYADYTPTEYIHNQFVWDLNVLEAAFEESEV